MAINIYEFLKTCPYIFQIFLQVLSLDISVSVESIADCYDVFKANGKLPGTYILHPDSEHQFEAYCLEDGWTAIQSRGQFGNPKDMFQKKWDEYVKGFGEPGQKLICLNVIKNYD